MRLFGMLGGAVLCVACGSLVDSGGGGSTTDADDASSSAQPDPPQPPQPTTGMPDPSGDPPLPTTTSTTSAGEVSTASEPVDDAGEESGVDFIISSDAMPDVLECDVLKPECPAGSKCVWYSSDGKGTRRDSARCVHVTGDVPPFHPCSLPNGIGPEITDDCGPESYCLNAGSNERGYCAPYIVDAGCGDYPDASWAMENGSTFPAACLYDHCNPLDASTCPQGSLCTFFPAWIYASLTCWEVPPQTNVPVGEPCDFGFCGEGKMCALAEWLPECEGERCCTTWCDPASPQCDDAQSSCEPFPWLGFQDPPELGSVGACVLPGAFDVE